MPVKSSEPKAWEKLYQLLEQDLTIDRVWSDEEIVQATGVNPRRCGQALQKAAEEIGDHYKRGVILTKNGVQILTADNHLAHVIDTGRKVARKGNRVAQDLNRVNEGELSEVMRGVYDQALIFSHRLAEACFDVLTPLGQKLSQPLPLPAQMERTPEEAAATRTAMGDGYDFLKPKT